MNGVSVQGRSSSTTYMPIFSPATGTLFFICVRLPHAAGPPERPARAPSGCERARSAEGALRVHLSQDPAGGSLARLALALGASPPPAPPAPPPQPALAHRHPPYRLRGLRSPAFV